MRRALFFVAILFVACQMAFTQDRPLAVAEREEAQERYKRMSAKIEDLETTIQAYNQQFQKMEAEIHRLRGEISKLREGASDSSAISEMRRKIETIERARIADQENVKEGFALLRKELVGSITKPPKSGSGSPGTTPQQPTTEKGFEYTIREGDTLGKLVPALNKQGIKVTQKQVEQANPGVDWNRLKVGKTIFIPAQK